MFKWRIITVASILFSLFLITGCADTGAEELEIVEQAIDKNGMLENGRFSTSHVFRSGQEDLEQIVEGSFIKQGDSEYDWYFISYPNAAIENSYTQRMVSGENFQQKMTLPEQEMTWEEIPDDAETLPSEIKPLFDMHDIENVESVAVEEDEILTRYTFLLNESHSEQVIEENVEALEENIELLEANDTPKEVIQSLEDRIQEIKDTVYSDFIYTYTIDEEGYAIGMDTQIKVTNPDGTEITNHNSYRLDDINLPDTEGFIPEVE